MNANEKMNTEDHAAALAANLEQATRELKNAESAFRRATSDEDGARDAVAAADAAFDERPEDAEHDAKTQAQKALVRAIEKRKVLEGKVAKAKLVKTEAEHAIVRHVIESKVEQSRILLAKRDVEAKKVAAAF